MSFNISIYFHKVFVSIFLFTLLLLTLCDCRRKSDPPSRWKGRLAFSEDFDGFKIENSNWIVQNSCEGKGRKDTNLECFNDSTNNVDVANGTLILRARPESWHEMALYAKPKNFTSGKVIVETKGTIQPKGYSYGAFVVRARLPKGKQLFPSIWLLPSYQDHDNCKYEEIDIVSARGQRTSTLLFCAHYGRMWNLVSTRKMEKVFRGVDFSESFHEFAVNWQPRRIEWFVDNKKVYEATTHFYSDWRLDDDSNLPCSKNKQLFKQELRLTISLSVGGNMFPEVKYGNITMEEAEQWPKPTLEVDWVRIYQNN